jgi:hypothetical protein
VITERKRRGREVGKTVEVKVKFWGGRKASPTPNANLKKRTGRRPAVLHLCEGEKDGGKGRVGADES